MSIVPPAIAWMQARWSPSKGERVRDAFPHAAAPSPPGRLWKRTRQKNKVPAPRPENGVAGHTRCERRAHLIGGALSTRCEQRCNLSRARVCAHKGPAGAMKPDREPSFTRALFYDDDLGSSVWSLGEISFHFAAAASVSPPAASPSSPAPPPSPPPTCSSTSSSSDPPTPSSRSDPATVSSSSSSLDPSRSVG